MYYVKAIGILCAVKIQKINNRAISQLRELIHLVQAILHNEKIGGEREKREKTRGRGEDR